jgi:hypothetical protein
VDGLGAFELHAGDVLYVPADTLHAAATTDGYSLHLTVGVLAVTYRHVVQRIVDRMEGLSEPLPLGFHRVSDRTLETGLARALHHSAARLAAADTDTAAADERRRAERRSSPRVPNLRNVIDHGATHDGTRLRRRPGVTVSASTAEDGSALLAFGERLLRMPPVARSAIEVVSTRDELDVGELTGLDEEGRAVLARRLLREGVVELCPVRSVAT